MRRALRHLFTIICALSLLLCVVVCVLWVRARHGPVDRVSVLLHPGRYAVRFDPDRVRLIGPPRPPVGGPMQEALGWELAGQIRNHDLGWSINGKFVNGIPLAQGVVEAFQKEDGESINITPATAYYQPDNDKPRASYPGIERPLTQALEDPDKWIIAHYLLWWEDPRTYHLVGSPLVRRDDVYVRDMGGLRIELPVPGPDARQRVNPNSSDHFEWPYRQDSPNLARIDLSQQSVIRNLWHDRLGFTLGTAPYWPVLLGSLVLPACLAGRTYRQVVRRRRGLCPACGYDLRESPERCPECGALVAKGSVTLHL